MEGVRLIKERNNLLRKVKTGNKEKIKKRLNACACMGSAEIMRLSATSATKDGLESFATYRQGKIRMVTRFLKMTATKKDSLSIRVAKRNSH